VHVDISYPIVSYDDLQTNILPADSVMLLNASAVAYSDDEWCQYVIC